MRFKQALIKRSPSSTLNRWMSLSYAALLLAGGLLPYRGYKVNTHSLFDFLGYDWPYYFSWSDFAFNIIAFVPFGTLLSSSLRSRCNRTHSGAIAVVLAALLSLIIETLQVFLHSRHPSNVDLLANSLGGAIGVLLSFSRLYTVVVIAVQRCHRACLQNNLHADAGLMLLFLWIILQSGLPFPPFELLNFNLSKQAQTLGYTSTVLRSFETGTVTLHFLAVGLIVITISSSRAQAVRLMIGLYGLTVCFKLMLFTTLLKSEAINSWFQATFWAAQPLGWGCFLLFQRLQYRLCLITAISTAILLSLLYFIGQLEALPLSTLFRRASGHFQDFCSISQNLMFMWWTAYLVYFIRRLMTTNHNRRLV